MPVWSVPTPGEQPNTLENWSVYEVQIAALDAPTRHAVGYAVDVGEGRVSSPIVEFDVTSRRLRTRSGRVYSLRGRPGSDADARYVWSAWKEINNAQELRDVTFELFPNPEAAS